MKMVQNFGCGWIFSIFSLNSWVWKVLVHEMSDKIQKKKSKFVRFMYWWRDVLIKLYYGENGAKFWVWINFYNFGRNSLVSKVLVHEMSDKIPKKIKIYEIHVLMKDGINKTL